MRISRKTDYALRALFTLVENHQGALVSIRHLAEQNDIPKAFLEHILLELKQKGWVDSVPGKNGGYRLSADPKSISLGQVVRLFDSQLAPISCVSRAHYEPCSQEQVCRFRRVFLQIRNVTARIMDEMSLAEVFAGSPVRREELTEEPFTGGAGI